MSDYRLDMMRKYLKDGLSPSLYMTYFGNPFQAYYRHITRQESPGKSGPGLFALLHRSADFKEAG
jgi:hypothetical protein